MYGAFNGEISIEGANPGAAPAATTDSLAEKCGPRTICVRQPLAIKARDDEHATEREPMGCSVR
jgi:hypothetical protein